MKSDVEIAQCTTLKPIEEVAEKMGVGRSNLELYGDYKAKINEDQNERFDEEKNGKLILMTGISPTPAGEGKTTTSIGLADALQKIGKNAAVAIREPSVGPVFGMKGGAAGGGYSQVVPMEDINLHFTGDFHAIGAANNLLAAMIDNHIYHGNPLNIDTRKIKWKRVLDMNDRQLRHIVDGLHGKGNGTPREDGFEITVASEIMAIFCLSNDIKDLKEKLKNIVIGYTTEDAPVTAGQLKAHGAMAALLKDAIKPNLVQTLEHTPAFVHGGPFANIAHGCNSIQATKTALKYADYVVTEAGFGADLGMEKFINIKCRLSGLRPSTTVVVATVRALKLHGGISKTELEKENIQALEKGLPNLLQHLEIMQETFGVSTVVAINKFPTDSEAELEKVAEQCREQGVKVVLSEVWANGGSGGEELAQEVVRLADQGSQTTFTYDLKDSIIGKLEKMVQKVYGGKGIELTRNAEKEIQKLEALGYGDLPVCMAKTPFSFSDDPTKIGRPRDFTITIRDVKLSAGAGFIVMLTGNIMTMPGLPTSPSAESIDVDDDGKIVGLY
ncbi:formate--tetrahydrofolate ligase [Geomicrobium halophilum]|uniref:Formate--tetrahydrofolate ligase n=1 Tax=Geomicrobium halophilum TaxID=549000 RepID=A0A841PZQ1_9BACL|nr:formate--tetrahydrofolate ligase [Geomicrobium halophilum]MBB6448258.1 formate--tetrahydrofolate ligase [Geomicrobium halophilum]